MPGKVLLIYTGGTIGMVDDPLTGSLKAINFKQLLNFIPDLKRLKTDIDTIAFEKPIDSSNADDRFWVKIVNIIKENYFSYDGFVILHGTDTMAFTGSALSFMISNLSKPIILTGAQLPLGTLRTDGRENLISAIEIASAKRKDGRAWVPEVAIFFENKLYRANRTHKYNAEYFDAFESPNYPPLAEAGIHIYYNEKVINYSNTEKIVGFNTNLDRNVAVLKLFPGINENYVDSVLNIEGIKGIILESYGTGNAPTFKWFLDKLEAAINKDIIIYNVTQCNAGRVELGRYETSKFLRDIGVLSGYDITFEAAVTKLMFLLGQNLSNEQIRYYLESNIAGEITKN